MQVVLNGDAKNFDSECLKYAVYSSTIEAFGCMVACNIDIIASAESIQQIKAAIYLSDVLLALSRSLLSKSLCDDQGNDQCSKTILDKVNLLLYKLSSCCQGKESGPLHKLRSLINVHIFGTAHFHELLLSAVNLAHIDLVNILLRSILEISGPERHRDMICKPLQTASDRNNTMLYRAIIGGGEKSISMIGCLVGHLVGCPTAFLTDTNPLSPNIRSYFFDQKVQCGAGKYQGPLHLAVINCNADQIKCLVELGADLNLQDSSGQTALHLAIKYADPEIVRYLLERGAIPFLKDSSETVAFDLHLILERALKSTEELRCLESNFQIPIIKLRESLREFLREFLALDRSIMPDNQIDLFLEDRLKPVLEFHILACRSNPDYKQVIGWLDLCKDAIIWNRQATCGSSRTCDSAITFDSGITCDSSRTCDSGTCDTPRTCDSGTSVGKGSGIAPQTWSPFPQFSIVF